MKPQTADTRWDDVDRPSTGNPARDLITTVAAFVIVAGVIGLFLIAIGWAIAWLILHWPGVQ